MFRFTLTASCRSGCSCVGVCAGGRRAPASSSKRGCGLPGEGRGSPVPQCVWPGIGGGWGRADTGIDLSHLNQSGGLRLCTGHGLLWRDLEAARPPHPGAAPAPLPGPWAARQAFAPSASRRCCSGGRPDSPRRVSGGRGAGDSLQKALYQDLPCCWVMSASESGERV